MGFAKSILKIFLWPLYWLSGFFPRNPKIWVFGSWDGKRFADNARWFFLYCLRERNEDVKIIWITRDRKLAESLTEEQIPVCCAFSLRGLWYALRAGVYVFDAYVSAINFWTSRGSVKINLWHGIPLKKIERDISNQNHVLYKQFHGSPLQELFFNLTRPAYNVRVDLITCTSQRLRKLFARAFDISEEQVVATGYPRNDILLEGNAILIGREKDLFRKMEGVKERGKKIIFYLPTFRDTSGEQNLSLDWEELERLLTSSKSCFFIKLHGGDRSKTLELNQFSNIIEVPNNVDPYPFLPLADILVTDYSSIFFDFLLINRPVIFYAYDLEIYLQRDREMYFPYDQLTPGEKVYDFKSFLIKMRELIESYENEAASWESERERILNFCHTFKDTRSSERVFRAIYKNLCGNED